MEVFGFRGRMGLLKSVNFSVVQYSGFIILTRSVQIRILGLYKNKKFRSKSEIRPQETNVRIRSCSTLPYEGIEQLPFSSFMLFVQF